MLADHLHWTIHCVGILVHLIAGKGETIPTKSGSRFLSPSRDHECHSHIDEMQMLRQSHVMLRIHSVELYHSRYQVLIADNVHSLSQHTTQDSRDISELNSPWRSALEIFYGSSSPEPGDE